MLTRKSIRDTLAFALLVSGGMAATPLAHAATIYYDIYDNDAAGSLQAFRWIGTDQGAMGTPVADTTGLLPSLDFTSTALYSGNPIVIGMTDSAGAVRDLLYLGTQMVRPLTNAQPAPSGSGFELFFESEVLPSYGLHGWTPTAYFAKTAGWQQVASVQAGANTYVVNVRTAPVPLPGAFWLLGSGLAGFGAVRHRRR